MLVLVFLLLTCLPAQGNPEEGSLAKQQHAITDMVLQDHEIDGTKQMIRECKGKCMAGIAQKAAAEAKAAQQAQNAAACKAAHIVKTQLAHKALQAAKAAEAELAGKQAAVEQLKQEVKHGQIEIAQAAATVHHLQSTMNVAAQAVSQATTLNKLLCQAKAIAAQLVKTSHLVVAKTRVGLNQKCHDLANQRSRLNCLHHKLQCAYADCKATKQAAHCACEAARIACGNARKKKEYASSDKDLVSKVFAVPPR